MTKVRRSERFYIRNKDNFLLKVEINPKNTPECFLNDISIHGACLILEKEIFLQRDRLYSFEILGKNESDVFEKIGEAKGKVVWYLTKEFRNKDMMYLGIEFDKEISISESIISNARVFD